MHYPNSYTAHCDRTGGTVYVDTRDCDGYLIARDVLGYAENTDDAGRLVCEAGWIMYSSWNLVFDGNPSRKCRIERAAHAA